MPGFTLREVQDLRAIKNRMDTDFVYETDEAKHQMTDYWEDDAVLASAVKNSIRWTSDCEEFAMVGMRKAIALGFMARLVVCLTETKEGHCICEVESHDGLEAYYIDNRKKGLATRDQLVNYAYYAVSPWNPKPGETRPWQPVALPPK